MIDEGDAPCSVVEMLSTGSSRVKTSQCPLCGASFDVTLDVVELAPAPAEV